MYPPAYAPQAAPVVVQQRPTVTATTTCVGGVDAEAYQSTRTANNARVLFGFAITGAIMGLVIMLLDAVPMGMGIRVFNLAYSYNTYSFDSYDDDDDSDYQRVNVNYYAGVWYGVLNILGCCGTLFYCRSVFNGVQQNPLYLVQTSGARVTGTLLAVLFGLMAATGIGAVSCAAIMAVTLNQPTYLYDSCNYDAILRTCICSDSSTVTGVSSCSYTSGPLLHVYQALAIISAALVVVDIVISSLFCGSLCCCMYSRYMPYMPMARHTIITNGGGDLGSVQAVSHPGMSMVSAPGVSMVSM